MYYKLLQKSARYDILENVGDFRLLDRKCINELRKLRETERYTKGMYAWIVFKKASVEFITQNRVAGESHMSIRSLISLAVEGVTSFTVSPLSGQCIWVCFLYDSLFLYDLHAYTYLDIW